MSLISVEGYRAFPIIPADHRLSYGDDENQFIDLYLPPNDSTLRPVVILIHGGCWRAQHGLSQLGQMARALAAHEVVVCNIEYRRLGNGGGWPDTFLDVAKATDALGEFADRFKLDLSRVVPVGHSAGGHLGLWLACRHKLLPDMPLYVPNPLPIAAVVSLAGIPDMEKAVEQNICRGAAQELLAGMPDEVPAHYAIGSPQHLLPCGVPQLHINGTEDWIVPIDYVRDCVERAQLVGDAAELIPIPNAGHFEIVSAQSAAWPTVCRAILGQV